MYKYNAKVKFNPRVLFSCHLMKTSIIVPSLVVEDTAYLDQCDCHRGQNKEGGN